MDTEVKGLLNEIKGEFLVNRQRMARQGTYDHTNELKEYHRELVSLLPWLGPHITKCNNQGSTLQMVKRAVPIATITDEDFPRTMLEDGREPCTSGATI